MKNNNFESPTKAKTISNFLGKNYEFVTSKGHIRDLPKSSFGIKIEEDGKFIPNTQFQEM